MNRHEKIAWYNLVVISASVLFFIILFFSTKSTQSLESSFKTSSSMFGLLGLLGLGQTFFRKEGAERLTSFFDPEMDERDAQIYRRAKLHAFSILWVLYVLITMGIWMYFQWRPGVENPVIIPLNVDILPMLIIPGFIVLMLIYSISILVQYRSRAASENSFDGPFVPNLRSMILSLGFLPVFILFGVFLAYQGALLFAFLWITIAIGASTMVAREIRRKTTYPENNPAAHGGIILTRIFNITFSSLFTGLIIVFIVRVAELGSLPADYVAYLLVLVFIGFIFHRTVFRDLKNYLRNRRHEKA